MISKDLVAASSRPLILSILSENEDYGYAILQKVRHTSHEQIDWTEGMLYPVLHRLEREGLILSDWKQGSSGRERKYYRLTPKGKQTLQVEKTQWLKVHNTLCRLWKMKPVSI